MSKPAGFDIANNKPLKGLSRAYTIQKKFLCVSDELQGVQLKSRVYFNMSNLFTKIYNMLYYTTNLYLQ